MFTGYDPPGDTRDLSCTNDPQTNSFYLLMDQASSNDFVWPRSQFKKVDILRCALTCKDKRHAGPSPILEKRPVGMMPLPAEIIANIMDILNAQGKMKIEFLTVNKLFYALILPIVYRTPILRGPNFFAFVETMSKSKIFGDFIRELDLSYVIQSGKNAFVAKLLKRSRKNLESFVAPQTSFGLGPLIALKNCHALKLLDLRLVSETLNLHELFKSIASLEQLTHLSFPRSSVEVADIGEIVWPPNLTFLRISGGLTNDFLLHSDFPETINSLEFAHCPAINNEGFQHMLLRYGRNLKTLKVQYPMPGLNGNSLDACFACCPNLLLLEVTVDYALHEFFDDACLQYMHFPRPLRSLIITASGMLGTTNKLNPMDLAVALDEGRLPHLKYLQCTAKLGWNPESSYVSYIVATLEERGGGYFLGY